MAKFRWGEIKASWQQIESKFANSQEVALSLPRPHATSNPFLKSMGAYATARVPHAISHFVLKLKLKLSR